MESPVNKVAEVLGFNYKPWFLFRSMFIEAKVYIIQILFAASFDTGRLV